MRLGLSLKTDYKYQAITNRGQEGGNGWWWKEEVHSNIDHIRRKIREVPDLFSEVIKDIKINIISNSFFWI